MYGEETFDRIIVAIIDRMQFIHFTTKNFP